VYGLNKNDDYSGFKAGDAPGMKQMIIASLLQLKDYKGDIK